MKIRSTGEYKCRERDWMTRRKKDRGEAAKELIGQIKRLQKEKKDICKDRDADSIIDEQE